MIEQPRTLNPKTKERKKYTMRDNQLRQNWLTISES